MYFNKITIVWYKSTNIIIIIIIIYHEFAPRLG